MQNRTTVRRASIRNAEESTESFKRIVIDCRAREISPLEVRWMIHGEIGHIFKDVFEENQDFTS